MAKKKRITTLHPKKKKLQVAVRDSPDSKTAHFSDGEVIIIKK